MIKFENTIPPSAGQQYVAIQGTRNAMNSWSKSDSKIIAPRGGMNILPVQFVIGDNDLLLARRLIKAGTDHRKFLRMLPIIVDITAPIYWIAELDTYKISTVRNSCSFMHKGVAKEFELSDFDTKTDDCVETLTEVVKTLNTLRDKYLETKDEKIFQQIRCLLPSGYLQKFTWSANYEVLMNIYHARKNHRLQEWRDFCEWIEELPLMNELLIKEN